MNLPPRTDRSGGHDLQLFLFSQGNEYCMEDILVYII